MKWEKVRINLTFDRFDDIGSSCSNTRLFPPNRMFIGLNVAHAGPMSYAQRAHNTAPKEPSVVGVRVWKEAEKLKIL